MHITDHKQGKAQPPTDANAADELSCSPSVPAVADSLSISSANLLAFRPFAFPGALAEAALVYNI